MSVAAIIPAHNEEKTIGNLVNALKNSGLFSQIVVVSDGSTDRTAHLAENAGAKVIILPENLGKGGAMTVGMAATTEPIVLFFDADISGAQSKHFSALIDPIKNNEADMVIGIRPELAELYKFNGDIPFLSGQRAMRREVFEQVPEKLRKGYQIEEALNYYCKTNNQRTKLVVLDGLTHLQKIPKTNLAKGIFGYVKMALAVIKIYIIVRIIGKISAPIRANRRR
ncbi:MAG: glycosyltransferase family 2 protein [Patescibacteria group bacterium]